MPLVGQSQVIRLDWYDRITDLFTFSFKADLNGADANIILETYTVPVDRLAVIGAGGFVIRRKTTPTATIRVSLGLTLDSVDIEVAQIFQFGAALGVVGDPSSISSITYAGGAVIGAGTILRALCTNGDTGGQIEVKGGLLINEFAV